MTDETEPLDPDETIAELARGIADLPPEPVDGAEDLPDEVPDGDAGTDVDGA